jgi:hypothetical protein
MKPFVKKLPKDLTSYDFLKSLAVITMIIDHIGFYFFPEVLEWRAVGRMSFPIWFFLVGYSNSRDLPVILWGGAVVLLISNVIFGMPLAGLNILFSIIIVRSLIDPVMKVALMNFEALFMITFMMMIMVLPTMIIFEYGTQGFLFAMFGYMLRHREKLEVKNKKRLINGFLLVSFAVYMAYQKITFGLNDTQFLVAGICVMTSCYFLYQFQPKLFPEYTKSWSKPIVGLFKLMGRKTLEIYVIHLILFKVIAFWLYPENYEFLQISWF